MHLVHRRTFPFNHYVLVDSEGELSPDRLLVEARQRAEGLARQCTGDPQNYTLIHNGTLLARRGWPHVHIVCVRSRFQKGLIYLVIGLKNLFADWIRPHDGTR